MPRTLTHAFPSGTKEVFEVTLASGRRVTATGNHPFLTYEGWMPLGELDAGVAGRRRCGTCRRRSTSPPRDEDEVVLLAHMLGDGSFVRRQPIRYASIDEANLTAVAEAAKRRFGITAVRDEYAAARVTTLRLPGAVPPDPRASGTRSPPGSTRTGCSGCAATRSSCPTGCSASPRSRSACSCGTSGRPTARSATTRRTGCGRVYYASTSRRLVDDLARLLLRFNVFTRIKRVRKAGYRDSWHLYVYGAENQLRFCDEIGVHGVRGEKADAAGGEAA